MQQRRAGTSSDNWLASAGRFKCALVGAVYTVAGMFPSAAFVSLVYRFPFPFDKYDGGVDAMLLSWMPVIFYGLVGGFPLLALLGVMAGLIAHARREARGYRNVHREILTFALAIDLTAALLLSAWDKIYGPF